MLTPKCALFIFTKVVIGLPLSC